MYGTLKYIYDLEKREKHPVKKETSPPPYSSTQVLCYKIPRSLPPEENLFLYNDLDICESLFPWRAYYKINAEIQSPHPEENTQHTAWHHWIHHGKIEERAFSSINNTHVHRARFGNLFFLNMYLHFCSLKFDLQSSYKYEAWFQELGISFHKGSHIYSKNLFITDHNFLNVLDSDLSPQNVILHNHMWLQSAAFSHRLRAYFLENPHLLQKIQQKNRYKTRYNKNNDLFIHIRLGDVMEKTATANILSYYKSAMECLPQGFSQGYISSDSLDHPFCQEMIQKYNLKTVEVDEMKTIQFASTCRNIILSGGTFSWLIGFFAFHAEHIYYPNIPEKWYGDIFCFSHWKQIEIE
jgi:hypothetical protein